MGIRAHPRLATGKTSKGHYGTPSLGCAEQTVRPSRQSISQTSAGMLLAEDSPYPPILIFDVSAFTEPIPLVDLSEPVSRGFGDNPWLIGVTARKNRPGDAGKFVGERDRQHVAVEPLAHRSHAHTACSATSPACVKSSITEAM
jgi:hypothetical protein